MLSPSVTERHRRLSGEAEYTGNLATRTKQDYVIIDEVEQPATTQLKDLLNQSESSSGSGYSRNRR